jgi:hypothetical protein
VSDRDRDRRSAPVAAVSDLELLRRAPLVTGRYQTWKPGEGVPIRSTVGYPRFWRHGPLVHARDITPYGVFGRDDLDGAAAQAAYVTRLDDLGDTVVFNLAAIARDHPGEQLVVLCFENVPAGESCHRRWFAGWMEDRYGLVVPELAAPASSAPTLF